MAALPSHPETAMEAMVVAPTADATAAAAAMEATGMDMTAVTGMAMAAVAMGMVMGEVAVDLEGLVYLFWVAWLAVFCWETCCLVGSDRLWMFDFLYPFILYLGLVWKDTELLYTMLPLCIIPSCNLRPGSLKL